MNQILLCAMLALSAAVEGGRTGSTIYVSKLGDNSDGSSWAKAYTTIKAALLKVPDDKGGHRVIIRPDTYVEANLYPSFKGAPAAYNVIMGDCDGALGSGAKGWVVIDSSCPDIVVRQQSGPGNPPFTAKKGGPEKGLKCVDWWGPWRCDPSFSAIIWDRWIFRCLYCTGSEGGIGWDMTCESNKPFSAIVEDCVGIGRFAGACVAGHISRPEEPVVFRRSYFLALDWWGDAGAAYVRGHNKTMPETPDAAFEDCVLAAPDNALQAGNPGFEGYTRVKFKDCKLIVLNFSQPRGTPSTGIIASRVRGDLLHVDFEDCTLMGYKVFGTGDKGYDGKIQYTVKGKVQAYVQFEQEVPKGIERLGLWPVEAFNAFMPDRFATPHPPKE